MLLRLLVADVEWRQGGRSGGDDDLTHGVYSSVHYRLLRRSGSLAAQPAHASRACMIRKSCWLTVLRELCGGRIGARCLAGGGRIRDLAAHGYLQHIFPHVIQIVVLATRANTLLRVSSALQGSQRALGIHSSHEDGLELVHARVGEEKGGIVKWNDTRRRPVGVAAVFPLVLILRLEEVDEGAADFRCRPGVIHFGWLA